MAGPPPSSTAASTRPSPLPEIFSRLEPVSTNVMSLAIVNAAITTSGTIFQW